VARSRIFAHLDPGSYRFEVEARSSSWQGIRSQKAVEFVISPPMYQRPAVALPIVLLLLLVITLLATMWERKRKYDRFIRDSEARFRAQYKSNPIPTFTWKRTGNEFLCADINDAALAMTQGQVHSWIGKPASEVLKHQPDSLSNMKRCFEERVVIHDELRYGFTTIARTADLEVTFSYIFPDMVMTHIEDVTERKRSETSIRESREQLRALASRLESVREEERTQLSREIHDELGQLMTGLKMDLAWVRKRVIEFGEHAASAMMGRLQQMNALLDDSIQTVRKISGQLRPALLDALGLVPAMEWQAKEWQARTGITCRIDVLVEEPRVSREQATELFRIFQELLTNVARHSGATEAGVVLDVFEHGLYLEVRDNGRGIREEEVTHRASLGILGMEERAARLKGRIVFVGNPEHGTTVRVTIPLEQEA
jgi:signal transduction histidine kinase